MLLPWRLGAVAPCSVRDAVGAQREGQNSRAPEHRSPLSTLQPGAEQPRTPEGSKPLVSPRGDAALSPHCLLQRQSKHLGNV
ncbi:hypothetical protein SKAU_G00298230 [Synaphobranchus kaupii]|uniref:Uncharacterized protein n=1 Tax=Synaphobranchus kaupii TaxID=118154 RepID=A0A9Q1EV62_SYNKA|nr:hypothetical protein SKAU_G00298230 [Synaphobranchus kaupii]